jgi:hypothetical protein
MLKNWNEIIESKKTDDKGKVVSAWKEELSKITDNNELLDLFEFLTEELKKDLDKFFNRSNRTAGRRGRNYAQKIKDTMQQIRISIQNAV